MRLHILFEQYWYYRFKVSFLVEVRWQLRYSF